jgi:two-component system chemotaxis response regulator CheB
MGDDTKARLNVLVVDDSALVRAVLSELLSKQGMSVQVAADPIFALEKMKRWRPDVIVTDLEMPRMDGLTFLRTIMSEDPLPVVICSGRAAPGSSTALRALEEGAIEIVSKPRLGVREFLLESEVLIADAVWAASKIRVERRSSAKAEPLVAGTRARSSQAKRKGRIAAGTDAVIAIGASTGGTDALEKVLSALPEDAPPVLVVQHMPAPFTRMFAERLDSLCKVAVKEAADGDAVRWGLVLIAPGNRHLALVRQTDGLAVEVMDGPLVSRHRPSVDVLLSSVAQIAGANAVGVILTGMGSDGASGLAQMKTAGAHTIAQDQATSVVFGMPAAAVARGAAAEVLALGEIAHALSLRARAK